MTPYEMIVAVFLGMVGSLIAAYIWSKKQFISDKLSPYKYHILDVAILAVFVPLLWAIMANVVMPLAVTVRTLDDLITVGFIATGLSFFVGLLVKPLFEVAYHLTAIFKPQNSEINHPQNT